MPTVISLERDANEQRIQSMSIDDLVRLQKELSGLESKRDELTTSISITKVSISESQKTLEDLENDTLADIPSRVTKCLETEKTIELLHKRLEVYESLLYDVSSKIPTIQSDIDKLQQHLEMEVYTLEIERYLQDEFFPLQEKMLNAHLTLSKMLTSPNYIVIADKLQVKYHEKISKREYQVKSLDYIRGL